MSVPRKRSQPDQFRILYVGYIRPQKGLEVLLAAHRLVQEDLPGAELCIVGGRDMPANAQTDGLLCKLEELRRTHALIFAGHVPFGPQLFQSYADADVLVAPSTAGEGTPRVLVEARAFGCPVIATTTGGIPSSVTDGVDGLLVPANDPVALRAAILRVATDHALRARLVAAGLRRARQCTVESFAEAMAAEVALLAEPFGRVVA
jgi:glycosyltransferase involved in cell wall biosynthesis